MNWLLINTSAWLTASGGGQLAARATSTATVSLNSAATNLTTGTYVANIWFTNQTSGGAQNLLFKLLVNQSLVQNGGFETGDWTGWIPPMMVSVRWLPPFPASHLIQGVILRSSVRKVHSAFFPKSCKRSPNQSYLLSLWFNSPNVKGGNTPNEFSVS